MAIFADYVSAWDQLESHFKEFYIKLNLLYGLLICLLLCKKELTLALFGDWSGIHLHCGLSLSQSRILQNIEADFDNPFSLDMSGLFNLDPSSLAAFFHFREYG